jgi:SAM-dependent methyltransferase
MTSPASGAQPDPDSKTPPALVAASRPDPIKRLQNPQGLADTGSQSAEPPRRKAERAAASRRNKGRKMKLHKRLERYITAIFKLGRTEWTAKQAVRSARHAEDLANNHAQDLGRIWQSISELEKAHDTFGPHLDRRVDTQMESYKAGLAVLSRTISDLTRRLDRLMMREGGAPAAPQSGAGEALGGEGFTAFKDQFYHRLENRYRGSRDEIANRLRIYLPDVEAAVQRTGGKPVMDLGCGRGEWLQVLGEAGVENAFGVDTNPVQIHEAQEMGLDVRQGDAVQMLADAKDASLSVITAHHLIEHLPFDIVAWITREALRVLAPGGLLMFETPNTRNVLVGATTFHTDPTHLKPMPEQVMGVLFETAGFYPVDIRHLNAHERFDEFRAKPDFNDELAFLMFGPQDLAVLGLKPQDKE